MSVAKATVWVIRHVAFEDLGSFAEPLQARGMTIRYLEAGVDSLTPLTQAAASDILVILGGPIGVYETADYPWLNAEIAQIRDWLQQGRPTLGICLGSQLMAAALGASVHPGHGKEIGFSPLQLTTAGASSPVRFLSGEHTHMLHWHGDTFDLPEGATLLASSALYPHQAFSWGARALAFQCHPEFEAGHAEQWLIGHTGELHSVGIDLSELRLQCQRWGQVLRQQGRLCLEAWLESL